MTDIYKSKLSRRNLFRTGIAGLLGGGAFGTYRLFAGRPNLALAGASSGVEDARYEGLREQLGRYILLAPQKLGGGTHAVDLATQKTLSWISY